MSVTRRVFMKSGAMIAVGMAAMPEFLARAAFAIEGQKINRRLLVIFQRGAMDGLNVVVPHGEPAYYRMRPTISIPQKNLLDLDGFFGLHPAMSALAPLWEQKQLAIVHAAGSPDPTRSHFDAQEFMESGTPGVKSTGDGWLNRTLAASGAVTKNNPFRAVAMGTALPRILSGKAQALAMDNINNFGVAPRNPQAQPLADAFESMYEESVDTVMQGTGRETFEAVKMLKSADLAKCKTQPGISYPKGRFGDALRQTAQLMKSELGVQIAFCEIGGWDHHVNEGATEGQLANLLREFSGSLAAFMQDLGALAEETVVVTMSEFGRTARENGTGGTDHGHANVMLVLGGGVHGGKVYGRWPGLDEEQLYERRDLALTTDFRQVIGEALKNHMGISRLNSVFPDFNTQSSLRLVG
jgi:uncharacterized protein (DUF1501 family)